MNNYRFKYLSKIDGNKWLICIIPAESLSAAIVKLKETRTIAGNQYRLAGVI